jgi:hypothetical protein
VAGILDEDVDPAMRGNDGFYGIGDRRFVLNVQLDRAQIDPCVGGERRVSLLSSRPSPTVRDAAASCCRFRCAAC